MCMIINFPIHWEILPIEQPLLPLDDEADGGEAHGHEVGDGEDHPGRHELRERRLVAPVHWGLELEIFVLSIFDIFRGGHLDGETGHGVRDVAGGEHRGGEGLEGLGQPHLECEAHLVASSL